MNQKIEELLSLKVSIRRTLPIFSTTRLKLFKCHICLIDNIPRNALITHSEKDYHERRTENISHEKFVAAKKFAATHREPCESILEHFANSIDDRCIIGLDAIIEVLHGRNRIFVCRTCLLENISYADLEDHVTSHHHWRLYLLKVFPSLIRRLRGQSDPFVLEKLAINWEALFGRQFERKRITLDSYQRNRNFHLSKAMPRVDQFLQEFVNVLLEGVLITQREISPKRPIILMRSRSPKQSFLKLQPSQIILSAEQHEALASLCNIFTVFKNFFESEIAHYLIDKICSDDRMQSKTISEEDLTSIKELMRHTQNIPHLRKLVGKIHGYLEVLMR